jgi:hypothetical protein
VNLKIADIRAGDILMCYSSMTAEEKSAIGTGYSHVALALREKLVLEASHKGVKIVSVEGILEDYDHIAVLRELNTNELWNEDRLNCLDQFAAQNIDKSFNKWGFARFPERKATYQGDVMERLDDHFEGTTPEVASIRELYFCSELVTAAFIYVGIIEKPAAIVFTPETFSPSDIAEDKAFGYFCGYVKCTPDYIVPDRDFFMSNI